MGGTMKERGLNGGIHMLRFIGTGSAFHTRLGNNSAYIKEKDRLLLIDCGGMVFHRLKESGLLEGITELYILITHPHPDQVGSLGDLLFYAYYKLQHSDSLPCFGFLLKKGEQTIYYSGDAREIPLEILIAFEKGEISALYQDTSGMDYEDNPHLSFSRLVALIPPSRRNQVTCMHLDERFPTGLAMELGFQLAKS